MNEVRNPYGGRGGSPSAEVDGYSPRLNLPREVGNTYATERDRYVVSLIVGYAEEDLGVPEGEGALEAAASALSLTRDGGSADTQWYVYDRKTGQLWRFEQHEFEDRCPEGVAHG